MIAAALVAAAKHGGGGSPPPAPTNVGVIDTSTCSGGVASYQVTGSWSNPGGYAGDYVFARNGNATFSGTFPAGTTSATYGGVLDGDTVSFQVRFTNSFGTSAYTTNGTNDATVVNPCL